MTFVGAQPGLEQVALAYEVGVDRTTLTRMKHATERAHARPIEALPPAERDAFRSALRLLVGAGNEHGRAPMWLA